MCSPFERLLAAALLLAMAGCGSGSGAGASGPAALTVCADPNNLPFSNRRGEGFENRIATLIAADLGMPLRYLWWPQRRGFARNTLNAGACDLIAGVPVAYGPAATTSPYYASTYVFVTRQGSMPGLRSFDDPRLRELRIGLHAMGDDQGSVPPALALAARGMVQNLRAYSIHGDYGEADPPARLIEAVGRGDIDVAIAWGPLAGFFARRSPVPLSVTPVDATADEAWPMRFAIAMAVRKDDPELQQRIDATLQRRQAGIRSVLEEYDVPLVAVPHAVDPGADRGQDSVGIAARVHRPSRPAGSVLP